MLRKFLSRVLHADLIPCCSWTEIDPAFTIARCSYDFPLPMSRVDPREQVLQKWGDHYTLFERSLRSGEVKRITFHGRLNGPDMRLSEWISEPNPVYQLKLCPLDGDSVVFDAAVPLWFGLWWNDHDSEMSGSNWYIKSTDRKQLEDLRFLLLDGVIPGSLTNQENMWQRINEMPESERGVAMATLAMHTFNSIDRKFSELHPELGSVPVELGDAAAAIQGRRQEIERLASNNPVDPKLDQQMRQFVSDAEDSTRRE